MDMRHGILSASRTLAAIQDSAPVPVGHFEITTIRHGEPEATYRASFPDRVDAYLDGIGKGGPGAVVIVSEVGGWLDQSMARAA
jgi:hypothetical protein